MQAYFMKNGPEEVKKEVVDLVANPYEISENWQHKKIYVPTEKDCSTVQSSRTSSA
jgi:hypothetical protein